MAGAVPDGPSGPGPVKLPPTVAELPRQVRDDLMRRLLRNDRAFRSGDVQVVEPPLLRRAVGASALGNCMEWFDFGVYSYLAATIGKVFFPGASPGAQVISSFATFAAAFVVRPLGGLFFGPFGDRVGREKVLATTMIMMALGAFAIGLIPPVRRLPAGRAERATLGVVDAFAPALRCRVGARRPDQRPPCRPLPGRRSARAGGGRKQ